MELEELLELYREYTKLIADQQAHMARGPQGEEEEVNSWEDHMEDELNEFEQQLEDIEYELHMRYNIDDAYEAACCTTPTPAFGS